MLKISAVYLMIQLIIIFDIKKPLIIFQIYVPLPRFPRPIQLRTASWYVLIYLYRCRKIHKDLLYAKSMYISCAGSHFYGTEYEIWADFERVGSTEKIWAVK